MKKLLRVLLAMGLVGLMVAPSLAGLAVDFTTPGQDFNNGSWSLGWEFTTNGPVTVNSLGFYDDLQNGLTESHDVGIYDAGGTLLVNTTVQTSDPLTSWFRFHAITPYTLAGDQTYYIMAVTGEENYTWGTTGFVVDPSINFIQDAYYDPPSGVLTFPNGFNASGSNGLFGPNFTTSPVPVPPSLLLLGSGLLGMGALGWRRRSS